MRPHRELYHFYITTMQQQQQLFLLNADPICIIISFTQSITIFLLQCEDCGVCVCVFEVTVDGKLWSPGVPMVTL